MHVDTYDALRPAGLLNPDVMAKQINDVLIANNITKFNELDDKPLIEDELREAIMGQQNGQSDTALSEINSLILEYTRPLGRCHDLLPDGYLLCTTRVRRKLTTTTGMTVVVPKPGRFVTDNPDIAMAFRENPAIVRIERSIQRSSGMLRDDIQRLPALTAKVPALIERLHGTLAAELPAPNPPTGGGQ